MCIGTYSSGCRIDGQLPPAPTTPKPVSALNAHEWRWCDPWLQVVNYEAKIAIVIAVRRATSHLTKPALHPGLRSPTTTACTIPGYRFWFDAPCEGRGHSVPGGPGLWRLDFQAIRSGSGQRESVRTANREMQWYCTSCADIARTISCSRATSCCQEPQHLPHLLSRRRREVEVEASSRCASHRGRASAIRTDVGAQPTNRKCCPPQRRRWEFRGIRKPDRSGKHTRNGRA